MAGKRLGTCGRALHAGPGLSPARQGLAAPFCGDFRPRSAGRVRGFSPAEMALPNHPDVAYEFVKTLRDCGYQWVLVQEHTRRAARTGSGPERKHLPHRLVCRNSNGENVGIIAIIKTQGSDTKLVAQMQPYYEAKGLSRWELAGKVGAAAGHADRRRRKRRRDDERVSAQVHGGRARMLRLATRRS